MKHYKYFIIKLQTLDIKTGQERHVDAGRRKEFSIYIISHQNPYLSDTFRNELKELKELAFIDILNLPGITPKVLAKELKELEQHKLIKRIITADYPVKITYTREPYADTLTPIIYALKDWGLNHRKKIFNQE